MLQRLKNAGSSPRDSKNWYKDRFEQVRVRRNFLAVLTVFSLLISLVSVSAVLYLAPLKSVAPFVIQVDDKTGFTQVVDPMTVAQISGTESINTYFAVKYLRARESYDYTTLGLQQEVVRVMSEPSVVWNEYLREILPDNKDSIPARLGTIGRRDIKIRSIRMDTNGENNLATIRFAAEERFEQNVITYNRIATIAFQYKEIALRQEDRYINPLGFLVTRYHVTEDDVQQ